MSDGMGRPTSNVNGDNEVYTSWTDGYNTAWFESAFLIKLLKDIIRRLCIGRHGDSLPLRIGEEGYYRCCGNSMWEEHSNACTVAPLISTKKPIKKDLDVWDEFKRVAIALSNADEAIEFKDERIKKLEKALEKADCCTCPESWRHKSQSPKKHKANCPKALLEESE